MQCIIRQVEIPQAVDVDFTNVDEVCAYRSLLCKIYECAGGFNLPAKSTPVTQEIKRQSLVWLREVKILIDSILRGTAVFANLGNIPRLLQSYDFFYRIGNGAPCYDYLREVKLRTVERLIKGDKSISQTDVALLLLSEIDRNVRDIEERYVKFALSVMSSWIENLTKCGKFQDISLVEAYKRLSYLLDADLSAFLGRKDEAKIKAQWVGNYILSDGQIEVADTETLWAYSDFIDSIPFSSQKEFERNNSMYMHILSVLALRPDIHPYLVKAIELTFKRRESLIA